MRNYKKLKPEARKGMVLLVVVIIVALLSLAGYAFVALMNSELDSTRQRGREMQMHYVTQSGVSLLESTATLSQLDRNWAGGTYDNPGLFCAASITDDWSAVQSPGRFTIVAPRIDNGRMTGIRYGLVNESAKLNLAKVLEWETANPGDGVSALQKLPGMSVQTAEAILDWIDSDNQQRSGGAEATYYSQMRLPYKPRNAVPVTLEEFLLVRGVTRTLMFGDDENFNFVPDSQEAHMAVSALPETQTGMTSLSGNATPAVPWGHLLTVVSAERDANPRGAARIDLNHANLEFLRQQLAEQVSPETADFVILYRQYGTAELNADTQAPTDLPAASTSSSTAGRRTRGNRGRNADQTPATAPSDTTSSDTTPPNDTSPGVVSELPDATTLPNTGPLDTAPLDIVSSDIASPDVTVATTSDNDLSAISAAGVDFSNTTGSVPPPLEIENIAPPTSPDTSPTSSSVETASTSRSSRSTQSTRPTRTMRAGSMSRGQRESRFSQYVNYQTPANFRIETPLDLINATIDFPQQGTTSLQLVSPLTLDASSLNNTLLVYLDEVSTSPSTTIIGRININEAPYEVIAGIPGLSQNAAREIVNRREQPANGIRDMYRHPTWLLAFDVVNLATLKQIWPHITCGGDVFRAQVIGFYEDIGTFSRVEVAVDATVYPPRRIDYKDLTSYGIGFHDRVLFGTIPQSSGMIGMSNMVQPSAPTLADYGGGGTLADSNAAFYANEPMSGFGMGTSPVDQSTYSQPSYSDLAPLEIPSN